MSTSHHTYFLKKVRGHSIGIVALCYFVFGAMGLSFAISPGYASPIFPAAGLAVALMLWSRNRVWPGIWLGSFLLNVSVSWLNGNLSQLSLIVAFAIATGATTQAFVASRLVVWATDDAWQEMLLEIDIVRSLLLAGAVGCLVSATTGVSALLFTGVITPDEYMNSWWNWWVGDTLGVLIAMPIVLGFLYRKTPAWRKRVKTVGIPMLIVLLVVTVLVSQTSMWEQQNRKEDIRKHGEVFKQRLEQRYIAHREAIASLARLFEVIPGMSYGEFEYFTRITLQDNPDIFALSFNPRVILSQRDAFERRMAASGVSDNYTITEKDQYSHLVPAGVRDEYTPVGYIAPLKGNAEAIGFDINSEPSRFEAVQQSGSSGNTAITAPIKLAQERDNRTGVLLLHPAYVNRFKIDDIKTMGKVMGFAVAVIKVDEMIDIATHSVMVTGLVYHVNDLSAAADRQLLFKSGPADMNPENSEYLWHSNMKAADHNWDIKVFPTDEYLHQQRTPVAWVISVIGLFFTALFQVLMLVTTGRTNLVEKKVSEQTKELKIRGDALEDSNTQLNALFTLSPDGFVAISHTGIIQFANPAFQAITGINNQDILFKDEHVLNMQLKSRAQSPDSFDGIAAYFATDDLTQMQSILVLQQPRKAVLQIIGMHSDSANASRILYMRDVTAESEVARIKSEFISHAAHELRTPMTTIYGYTELLLNKTFDEKLRHEMLEAIQRQSSLIINMVNELLDLARIDARGEKNFKFENMNINDLLAKIMADLKLENKDWNVQLSLPESEFAVRADAEKLSQAIMNVLTNADKYSAAGALIAIELLLTDGYVGVAVTDHGIGMTEEQLSHVGERFWRADMSGSTPGTGLGMSIVKEIIEFHGGYVEIKSRLNMGTTVTLWLPRVTL